MAIQDKDSERRNLVVTSLGFILYFAADGYIINNELRIQLFNIGFRKPETLAIVSWVLFLWFSLRYWQTHQGLALKSLNRDICHVVFQGDKKSLIWYSKRRLKLPYEESNGFVLSRFAIEKSGWNAYYTAVTELKKNSDGLFSYKSKNNSGDDVLKLNGIIGLVMKLYFVSRACVTRDGFTSYSVPYLLFWSAMTLAIIRTLQ
jgi:hypothetical protein